MKNNERKMTEEARQNIAEAMNNTFGHIDTDNLGKIYAAPGELCVSRLEYSILLRKAHRYDMLIAALLDSTRLEYGNELQVDDAEKILRIYGNELRVDDAEKILRIFEKEKYIHREKQLLDERAAKRRESEE